MRKKKQDAVLDELFDYDMGGKKGSKGQEGRDSKELDGLGGLLGEESSSEESGDNQKGSEDDIEINLDEAIPEEDNL